MLTATKCIMWFCTATVIQINPSNNGHFCVYELLVSDLSFMTHLFDHIAGFDELNTAGGLHTYLDYLTRVLLPSG